MDDFETRLTGRIGRCLRRRRRDLGLSQEDLAERTGVHRTPISLFENGHRLPHTSTLIKLAIGLEIPVCQILLDIEWPVPGSPLPGTDAADLP